MKTVQMSKRIRPTTGHEVAPPSCLGICETQQPGSHQGPLRLVLYRCSRCYLPRDQVGHRSLPPRLRAQFRAMDVCCPQRTELCRMEQKGRKDKKHVCPDKCTRQLDERPRPGAGRSETTSEACLDMRRLNSLECRAKLRKADKGRTGRPAERSVAVQAAGCPGAAVHALHGLQSPQANLGGQLSTSRHKGLCLNVLIILTTASRGGHHYCTRFTAEESHTQLLNAEAGPLSVRQKPLSFSEDCAYCSH